MWLSVVCNFLFDFCADFAFDAVIWIILGPQNSTVNNSVSHAIKRSGQISLTKNIVLPEENIETTIVVTRFENGNGKNTTCVWSDHGYFKQKPCDFHMIKENYSKNSILYINQGYLTIKHNKKFYYADHYIIGQVNEFINPPKDIHNYVCKEREVKLYPPKYDPVTGQFLGLYESLGFIVVRGDPDEHFLDYRFCKENSKILYSYHRRRIPSSFNSTFFQ